MNHDNYVAKLSNLEQASLRKYTSIASHGTSAIESKSRERLWSPEKIAGSVNPHKEDIWSLGVLLRDMRTLQMSTARVTPAENAELE